MEVMRVERGMKEGRVGWARGTINWKGLEIEVGETGLEGLEKVVLINVEVDVVVVVRVERGIEVEVRLEGWMEGDVQDAEDEKVVAKRVVYEEVKVDVGRVVVAWRALGTGGGDPVSWGMEG